MGRRCLLPALLVVASALHAAPPEIAVIRGSSTRIVYGAGFVPGAVELRVTSPAFDAAACLAALAGESLAPAALLPAEPPADAVKAPVLEVDPRGFVLAAAFDEAVCWARNADGWGRPAMAGVAGPTTVLPAAAAPGERVRLFGRDMQAKLVALRSEDGHQVLPIEGLDPVGDAAHECAFRLPGDLAEGPWQVYVHNGRGGTAGWGGGLTLRVQRRPPPPINVTFVDARLHGARGNGVADETNSLRQALIVAAKTKDTVVLPPGRFPLRGTLEIPPGVSLVGAGPGTTILEVQDDKPFFGDFPPRAELDGTAADWLPRLKGAGYAPMVWLRDRSALANLTLEAGPGVGLGVLVAAAPGLARDVRIEHCAIHTDQPERGSLPGACIVVAGDTQGLTVRDNRLLGHGGLTMLSANARAAVIVGNEVRCLPSGRYPGLALRGLAGGLVEDNLVSDGAPNLSVAASRSRAAADIPADRRVPLATLERNAFIGNQTLRGRPAPADPSERPPVFWQGAPTACDETTLTVDGTPFWSGMTDTWVVVVAGRGVGQYRRVVSNTASTLTVQPGWSVAPDEQSLVLVDGFDIEPVWLNNTEERADDWAGLGNGALGGVVGGLRVVGGGLRMTGTPLAWCDLVGCELGGSGLQAVGVGLVGNALRGSTVRVEEVPDRGQTGLAAITWAGAEPLPSGPQAALRAAWNLVEDCRLSGCATGLRVRPGVEHLILRRNRMAVTGEVLDDTTGTVVLR